MLTEQALAGLIAGLHGLGPNCTDIDTNIAVLTEAAKLAQGVLAANGKTADAFGARLEHGRVKLPTGQKTSWTALLEGGWTSLADPEEFGGQDLPLPLAVGAQMLFDAEDVALGMLALNQRCAVRLLRKAASAEMQETWIPRLISGEWAATICISEPDAGSDVGRIRSMALEGEDGIWRISGQKCWISYGDHDLAPHILHLVLARTPGQPPGTKGLSLFLLPDVKADGSRNGIETLRIEEKMGLHASPTCVLALDGAEALPISAEGQGLKAMFGMITGMRLGVGGQCSALAARACEIAWAYAAERLQGGSADAPPVPIYRHAEVRRLLLDAKLSATGAMLLTLQAAAWMQAGDEGDEQAAARVAVLLPVVKTLSAEAAFEAASNAMQVLGGAGYTREWPVERILRDSRVASIFEGTSAIQALDLLHRQLLGAGATTASDMLALLSPSEMVMSPLQTMLAHLANAPPPARDHAALPALRLFGLACIDGLLRRHKNIIGEALLAWHEAGLAAKATALVAAADWVDTAQLYAALA